MAVVISRSPCRKPCLGKDEPHVPDDRLDDHRGDVVVRVEQLLEGGEIVEGSRERVGYRAGGHARRVRQTQRRHTRARLDEQEVRVPVVTADELDDLRALRERARDANRAHRRLRAGAHEADELEARHRVADEPREVELEGARRAEARSLAQRLLERGYDPRMRVAEDQRAPREDVVHVAVPVDVDEIRALAAVDEERRAADRLERAHRRADAARQQLERLGEEPLGGLARHARAPASARATDSAASSPERMQSGIPTPRYAAPATARPGMLRYEGIDLRETLRMTEEVLGHPEWPAVYAGEHRLRHATDEPDLGTSERDQRVVGVLRQIASAEPPRIHANQHRLVGRAAVPLLRRPRACEHVRAIDARNEVPIAVERRHIGA